MCGFDIISTLWAIISTWAIKKLATSFAIVTLALNKHKLHTYMYVKYVVSAGT